ncbi:MAG: ATP-binding protein [Rhodospirillales bacterium]
MLFVAALGARDAVASQRNLLFISSYHPTFHSFEEQIDGLRAGLDDALGDHRVALTVEFMDTKRFPSVENVASFRSHLVQKMAQMQKPDIVVVADDNALEFAVGEKNRLFASTPIVFLGINDVERAVEAGADPMITGVVETTSIGETATFAKDFLAESGKLLAIVDNTTTGRLNRKALEASDAYARFGDRIRILSLEEMTFDDLAEELRQVPEGCAVLLITAFRDMRGDVMTSDQAARLITENASVPFVHPWRSTLGKGSLGGIVVSHFEQGWIAGDMAGRILDGANPSSVPVVKESPNRLVVDFAVAERYGFDNLDIPEGAEVLNPPPNVFREHGQWIWGAIAFLAVESAIIVVLIIAVARRRRAERELRRSNLRFRAFAESTSDWFWESDPDGRLTWLSVPEDVGSARVLGDMVGRTRPEIVGADNDPDIWWSYEAAIEERRDIVGFEYPFRDEEGTLHYVRIDGRPVFDDDGTFTGYLGAGKDVTRQKRVLSELQDSILEATRASDAKSRFLATVSHEFRTPLNAIIGFSELMRAEVFGPVGQPVYKEYVEDIASSGNHMMELVNDVLDVTTIESGKRDIVIEQVDLRDIVELCKRKVASAFPDSGVTVKINVGDEVASIQSDQRAVMQIILNLMSNAVKFSDKTGEVRVDVRRQDHLVLIDVEDQGIGIPEDLIAGVIEPFSQSHGNPHLAAKGTGLGLSIVNGLVEELHGTLEIHSVVGVGSRFTVKLPLAYEEQQLAGE